MYSKVRPSEHLVSRVGAEVEDDGAEVRVRVGFANGVLSSRQGSDVVDLLRVGVVTTYALAGPAGSEEDAAVTEDA